MKSASESNDGMAELHYLGLGDVAHRVQSRELSSVEVTRHMLERVARLDGRLRSYATVTAEVALAQAEQADAEIAGGRVRGPLHGVPIGIKDLCATRDAPTHVGSIALRHWNPGVDCAVVARLRAAGSVFLGKLQMTEAAFAAYHPDITPPINPWGADYWTGVSSSGPGVATAAGLCFGSLGTDTGGSIRFPSHACGVTGIKPTWGRVSRAGAHAVSDSLDHIGPMARSAADVAALLGIIAGRDPGDPTTLSAPVPDYLAEIDRGIAGLRVGFDERYCTEGIDPIVTRMIEDAADVLRGRGAVIRAISLPDTAEVVRGWTPLCAPEAAIAHAATYPARAAHYGRALARFIDRGRAATGVAYARAQLARQKFTGNLSALFGDVDVILWPTQPYPTPTNAFMDTLGTEEGAVDRLIAFAAPHNMSGHPTISLPGGFDPNGLPLGFQLVGPHLGEAALVRAGHAYQQDTAWHRRRPPLAV
jgi:amidase